MKVISSSCENRGRNSRPKSVGRTVQPKAEESSREPAELYECRLLGSGRRNEMTTLLQILAATLLSSVLSIVLAGLISFKFLDRYMSKMLCISAGLLLTVAFTHLLPEAFEIHENAASVGWTLLVSVLFLFCLEFALSHQHHSHVNPPEQTGGLPETHYRQEAPEQRMSDSQRQVKHAASITPQKKEKKQLIL